jgi:hypothetical protein
VTTSSWRRLCLPLAPDHNVTPIGVTNVMADSTTEGVGGILVRIHRLQPVISTSPSDDVLPERRTPDAEVIRETKWRT